MKTFFVLFLTLPFFAQAAEQPFDAYCELQKSKGSVYRSQPFARFVAAPDSSMFFSFSSRVEAESFEGVEEDRWSSLVRAGLESKGKNKVFARPSLKEAKARANSAQVYKVKTTVFENPELFKGTGQTFKLEVEFRDYDDDYSGVFYWTHGYVVKDRGTFTCVVL